MSLQISEIYSSIQGETHQAGRPCTLVRLTGCDLRCSYCDSEFAFAGGRRMELAEVVAEVESLGLPLVLLTGGEPLLQPEAVPLARALVERGYEVMIETGGHRDTSALPAQVAVVLDVKTPASGEAGKVLWANVERLGARDAVKFVICSRADYEWARDVVQRLGLQGRTEVLLSPSFGEVEPRDLVGWMLEDRLGARLNLQLHKYVWSPETRGV